MKEFTKRSYSFINTEVTFYEEEHEGDKFTHAYKFSLEEFVENAKQLDLSTPWNELASKAIVQAIAKDLSYPDAIGSSVLAQFNDSAYSITLVKADDKIIGESIAYHDDEETIIDTFSFDALDAKAIEELEESIAFDLSLGLEVTSN